jgi:hypothetical protein
MVDAESLEDFAKLYKLRAIIRQSGDAVPKNRADTASAPSPTGTSLYSTGSTVSFLDARGLLREGLGAMAGGDEDRAEFLTQAAIRAQADHPITATDLWKEYGAYLDHSPKLTPYDRLARLSAYLDSVEASLLACRNTADFQAVWAVRKAVVNTRVTARSDLLAEANKDVSKVSAEIKTKAATDRRGALRLIASHADQLKPRLLIVFATAAGATQSSEADSGPLRDMLNEAIGLATSEVESLKKRRDDAAALDAKGTAVEPSPKYGEYEGIFRDASDLASALEAADLHSWGLIVMPGKDGKAATKAQGIGTSAHKEDSGPDATLARVVTDLDQLRTDLARLQGIRYNLWALRTIYGAESTDNWDSALGQIDVGLLHPTVNALYSITYDTLVRKQTDPQIRARIVQNILNSKKQALPAF